MKKNVLITGITGGLGEKIVIKFAQNGFNIIGIYNNNVKKAEIIKINIENNYDVKIKVYKCDIKNEEEIKKIYEEVKKEFIRIDVLVNNAGVCQDNALNEKGGKEFTDVLKTNLTGTFLVTKYMVNLIEYGAIINISSTNAIDTGYIESIDYDASKAGIIALTHDFAKYLAPNIRVNCLMPGWIETEMNKNISPLFKEKEINKIGLKRFAKPEEIANVIYFLASEEASYVNDAIIRVDGGKNAE